MIAIATNSAESEVSTWQESFLEMLPMIEQHARIAFRGMDAETQDDAVSEVIANAMCAYHRLHERGELQRAFATALARYAVAQYHAGRRVGTSQCSRDVYSTRAKKKAGYDLLSLGTPADQHGEWMERLVDNRRTPVPDQVAFRLDFPRWLNSQTARDRRIAERLSLGCSTGEVAREFKISPARISQLRKELAESWHEFTDDQLAVNAS